MRLETPKNSSYAAVVVRANTLLSLDGLDKLVGVPVLGHQALTTLDGIEQGDLRIAFTAETQLSEEFCYENSLYREVDLNRFSDEKGYLEKNRRIRAIKLRGHRSNALLMPLSSVAYTGADVFSFKEGDTFDALGGREICRKYEVPVKPDTRRQKSKVERAFRRVDAKQFPEHLETDQYWRNKHLLKAGREIVITQKLHGTSWRGGNVPVLRSPRLPMRLFEKLLRSLGVTIPTHEYAVVFGSRKVIKDPSNSRQQHFYKDDIWTEYGKRVAEVIPEGYIVYGELIGWTSTGGPIQKNYTYHLPDGEAELYVYRVAVVDRHGSLADLSWDGVKDFCVARGLKWVPELARGITRFHDYTLEELIEAHLDERLADFGGWNELPLIMSSHKTVDEGVCLRQEGLVPLILKAKSPVFLEHETRLLDAGELDMESANGQVEAGDVRAP